MAGMPLAYALVFFICNVLCITKERPIRSTLSSLADEATTTLNLHALC